MIIGFIGPEGGGKTASLTWATLRAWSAGLTCYAFKGYEAYFHDKVDGKIVDSYTITQEIGPEKWAAMDGSLKNCFIAIDQIENFFGAEQWMGILDRLFGAVCQQRRKLNMTIAYTTHNMMWINNRIRKETHMAVHCRDLYWDKMWKQKGLKKGSLCHWTCVDNLGLFGAEGKVVMRRRLPIEQLWDCFDTFQTVNVWEGFAKGVIKNRQKVEIDLGAPVNDGYNETNLPDYQVDTVDLMRQGQL